MESVAASSTRPLRYRCSPLDETATFSPTHPILPASALPHFARGLTRECPTCTICHTYYDSSVLGLTAVHDCSRTLLLFIPVLHKKFLQQTSPRLQWASRLWQQLATSVARGSLLKANGTQPAASLFCVIFVSCALCVSILMPPSPTKTSLPESTPARVSLQIPSVLLQIERTMATTEIEADCAVIPGITPSRNSYTRKDIQSLNQLWGAERIDTFAAWQAAGPLSPVLVAILDTGIDTDGPLLETRIDDSIVLAGSSGPTDLYGHGTHIAGTVASIAPNARLLNVKIADDRGYCDSSTVATGIRLAVNRGAAIINLSLEVEASPELESAVRYAWQKGVVVVAAAGTYIPAAYGTDTSDTDATASHTESTAESSDPPLDSAMCAINSSYDPDSRPCRYPASYVNTIAVTGTDLNDGLAPLSPHGSWIDVAAPGFRIPGYLPGGESGYLTGTSSAAAHVSGVAALLCGVAIDKSGNGLVNDEVRSAIEESCTPLPVSGTGEGLVNALAAMKVLSVYSHHP